MLVNSEYVIFAFHFVARDHFIQNVSETIASVLHSTILFSNVFSAGRHAVAVKGL